jgi:hypothetical protein
MNFVQSFVECKVSLVDGISFKSSISFFSFILYHLVDFSARTTHSHFYCFHFQMNLSFFFLKFESYCNRLIIYTLIIGVYYSVRLIFKR